MTVETKLGQTNCIYWEWDLPDSAVTPETYYLQRREFLRVFGLGLAASALLPHWLHAESAALNDSLNSFFKLDGVKLTPKILSRTIAIFTSGASQKISQSNWLIAAGKRGRGR